MSNLTTPSPGARIVADHIAQLTSLLNSALGLTVRSQSALGRIELPSSSSNPASPANYQAWMRSDLGVGGRLHMRHTNASGQNVAYLPLRKRTTSLLNLGSVTTNTTSWVDLSGISMSVDTTGGVLEIYFALTDGAFSVGSYVIFAPGTGNVGFLRAVCGSTNLGAHTFASQTNGAQNDLGIGNLRWETQPAAGTYTIKLQGQFNGVVGGTQSIGIYSENLLMVVREYGD